MPLRPAAAPAPAPAPAPALALALAPAAAPQRPSQPAADGGPRDW